MSIHTTAKQQRTVPMTRNTNSRPSSVFQYNGGGVDPVIVLNEECLWHVFSFPVGDDDATVATATTSNHSCRSSSSGSWSNQQQQEFLAKEEEDDDGTERRGPSWSLLEAFQFYHTMASVSCGWKQWMDTFMALLDIGLMLDYDDGKQGGTGSTERISALIPHFVKWMNQHKLRLSALKCTSIAGIRSPLPLNHLLQACDATALVHAQLAVTIPTTNDNSFYAAVQRSFHNAIAKHCPNLRQVFIELLVHGDESEEDYARSTHRIALWAMPSVRHLAIHIKSPHPGQPMAHHLGAIQPGTFLSYLISNFPSLTTLVLKCPEDQLEDASPVMIASQSLRVLRVEQFCTERVKLHLSCPRLAVLSCAGACCSSYLASSNHHDRDHDIAGQSRIHHNEEESFQYGVRQMISHTSRIPEACQVFLIDPATTDMNHDSPSPIAKDVLQVPMDQFLNCATFMEDSHGIFL